MEKTFEIRNGILYRYNESYDYSDGKRTIAIPDGVTRIAKRAFADCYLGCAVITMPDSLTVIEDEAFSGCDGIDKVTIGRNVTYIGEEAFDLAGEFESIAIPDSVTELGDYAFSGSEIKNLYIGKGLVKMGESPFGLCDYISRIEVSPENPVYHSAGNCLIKTDSRTLVLGCGKSEIPEDGSVTEIGENAFWGSKTLVSITVPDCITKICDGAFRSCRSLERIRLGQGITDIGKSVLHDDTALTEIRLPRELRNLGDLAFANCARLAEITIPASTLNIGEYAFIKCKKLKAAEFRTPQGWKAGGGNIPENVLANPKKAAKLLRKTASNRHWQR